MKTTLYYFTGTGNTLAVAKALQSQLGDCKIYSIPQILKAASSDESPEPRVLPISGEAIGIVTPIYMHNMPHIVGRFIEHIEKASYLFFVYTGGGDLGRGLRKTQTRLAKRGLSASAIFNVPLPSNYTPYGYPEGDEQRRLFAEAEEAVQRIAGLVNGGSTQYDGIGTSLFAANVFPGPLYQLGYRFVSKMDGRFTADENCTHCGICERVCPVGNITLTDGEPVWHHSCEQCYACLQWCPVQAIQYGNRTRGVPRYHHPHISLQEVIDSAGREVGPPR